jgi:hypothetical protein
VEGAVVGVPYLIARLALDVGASTVSAGSIDDVTYTLSPTCIHSRDSNRLRVL